MFKLKDILFGICHIVNCHKHKMKMFILTKSLLIVCLQNRAIKYHQKPLDRNY